MAPESQDTFETVKARLDQIVDAVGNEDLPLDEALALYEEAVGLGLRASDLLEENIEAQRAADDAAQDGEDAASDSEVADAGDAAGQAPDAVQVEASSSAEPFSA